MAFCSRCGAQVPDGAGFCPACGTPVGAGSGPQSVPASGLTALTKEAGAQEYWVKRVIAYAIDAIVVYVVIFLVAAAVAIPSFFASVFVPGYSSPAVAFGALLGPLAGLILVLYFTLAEATYGKTIGKSVMGLRVAVDGSSRRPNVGLSFFRNLSKIYWILLLLDVILGLALDPGYDRKWSDKYLGTRVVPSDHGGPGLAM